MKFDVLILILFISCGEQKINLNELSGYWEIEFVKKTKNTFLILQFYNTIII